MSTHLDFETTRKGLPGDKRGFRDFLIKKTLNVPFGPQTFTASNYIYNQFDELPNNNPGDVVDNDRTSRADQVTKFATSNVYKPDEYFITEDLSTLPRKANLTLYPYFVWNQRYNLVGLMGNSTYDTESELMRFAATYIKEDKNGPVWGRFAQNLYTTTAGKVRLLDALEGNTSTAINILTGREPLVEMNTKITVAKTALGKGVDFLQTVSGVEFPWSEIPGDYLSNPKNPINNPRPTAATESGKLLQDISGALGQLIGIQRRATTTRKPSDLFIEYLGARQKTFMNDALSYSKYGPDYTTTARSQNSSKVFNFIDKVGAGVNKLFGMESPKKNAYIGDDRGNDVKYAMNDLNERVIKSSYYLSLMFDAIQAQLFERQKNFSDGGGISGKLTWISSRSQNKLYSSESKVGYTTDKAHEEKSYSRTQDTDQIDKSLSKGYTFRDGSILGTTQELLESMPEGGAARSHVANVIDQTSRVFREGDSMMSRGSAVKYVNQFTGTESGVEYCRVWTKDRSYLNYSDTMKKSGGVRKFESSVLSRPWNLNIYPNSNGNGAFDSGSTNIVQGKNGFYAKKYMFSVENLAWKTSNTPGFTYNDLPYCERGPNGGRVMWFPPYDLKVSEQNSTNWESNKFLGRPEPVYTYNSTERSGTISFRVIVDHPSVLNLLVREHFKNMSDEESDNYINAFFAGCEEIDFYGLVRKYTTLTPDDVKAIQSYLNNGKDPNTIIRYNTLVDPVRDPYTPKNDPTKKSINTQVWFKNDYPDPNSTSLYSTQSYSNLYTKYIDEKDSVYIPDLNYGLAILTGGTWGINNSNDYNCIVRKEVTAKPSDDDLNKMIITANEKVNEGFSTLVKNYDVLTKGLASLKKELSDGVVQDVKVTLGSRTSSIAEDHYNLGLAYRRSHSVLIDILSKISDNPPKVDAIWTDSPKSTDVQKDVVKPFEITLKELGYDKSDGKFILEYVKNIGEQPIGTSNGTTNADCTNKYLIKTSSQLKMTAPNTFWCRETNVGIDYTVKQKTDTPVKPPEPTRVPVEVQVSATNPNTTPPMDEMKKIVMRALSECYYFKKLEEDSPVQFSSLKEKLRYFHPAFHSMTPEGLNSRLTFLLQCLRPGGTIPIKGLADYSDLNARNTTFGPPPICVLRIGDFYHSKIVIKDVNIDFEEGLWDLNPEGIGVQPMMAKVSLQVYFIGGHGLEKPVERLQNALSSNFYANTEMYDPRATATEDRTAFTKEFLSELVNPKDNKENSNQTLQDKPNSNVEKGSYIGEPTGIASINDEPPTTLPEGMPKVLSYRKLVDTVFEQTLVHYSNFIPTYNNIVKGYGSKLASMVMSPSYRTNKTYTVETGTGTETIELLGEYSKGSELEALSSDFKGKMLAQIKTDNITTIFGFNKVMNDKAAADSEVILKTKVSEVVGKMMDDITKSSINGVLTSRNSLIVTLDKLNFMAKVYHDGTIIGDSYSGITLTNFINDDLYKEYRDIIPFVKKYQEEFYNDLDVSFVFGKNSALTTEILSDFLSEMLSGKIEEIMSWYTDKTTFNDRIQKDMRKKLDKFLESTRVDKNFSMVQKNYPSAKNGNKLNYLIEDFEYSFTPEEKTMLTDTYKMNNNKSETTLNYYR